MAKTTLPTNYVDDVLNGAMDGKRRYREIPNADGTISLEDATTYDQVGSNFGASQLNLMSDNINQSFDANKMLKTMDEVNAVTQEGYGVDALVVKHVNESLGEQPSFVYDDNGQITGYTTKIGGADTVFPFRGIIDDGSFVAVGNSTSFQAEIGAYYIVVINTTSGNTSPLVTNGADIIASYTNDYGGRTTLVDICKATNESISVKFAYSYYYKLT